VSEPSSAETSGSLFSGRTVWHNRTALREFLRTETGSALVLATATVAALVWANISVSSYDKVWGTQLSVLIGSAGVTMSVHEFVNSGLMALFFLVVGLEARREFDVGELRVRSRLALPVLVGEDIVAALDLKTDRQNKKLLMQKWNWVGAGRRAKGEAKRALKLGEFLQRQWIGFVVGGKQMPDDAFMQVHQRIEFAGFVDGRKQRGRVYAKDASFDGERGAVGAERAEDDVVGVKILGDTQHGGAA